MTVHCWNWIVCLTLHIFLPAFSVAFEYQGEGHFHKLPIYGSFKQKQNNDQRKAILAKGEQYYKWMIGVEGGISLIDVPYWWDKTKDSLLNMISKQRPDIVEYREMESSFKMYQPQCVIMYKPNNACSL